MGNKIILMQVEIPEHIESEFFRYDSIDAIIDSMNIVLHKTKIIIKKLR